MKQTRFSGLLPGAALASAGLYVACCLLAAGVVFAGIAQSIAKPTEDDLLSQGYEYVGEQYADKFDELEGLETRIRVYYGEGALIGLYQLEDLSVYAFSRQSRDEPIRAFVDANNDGLCEVSIEEGEDFVIDFSAYGLTVE